MLRHLLLIALLISCPLGLAAETAVAEVEAANPAEAIVASGDYIYRQKDLDALMLVARRHLGRAFSGSEEPELRRGLRAMLTAREALIASRLSLPQIFTPAQLDRLSLDLLDFQAQPAQSPSSAVAAVPPAARPAEPTPPAPAASGETELLALPPIAVQRSIRDQAVGLSINVTLLGSPSLKAQLPLVQDAILSYLHGLDEASFVGLSLSEARRGLQQSLATYGIERILITSFSR